MKTIMSSTASSSSCSFLLLCLVLGITTRNTVTQAFLVPSSPFSSFSNRYIILPTKNKRWMALGGKTNDDEQEEEEASMFQQWQQRQQQLWRKRNIDGAKRVKNEEEVDSKSRRELLLLSLLGAVTTTTATTAAVASASMTSIQNDPSSTVTIASAAATAAAAAASTTILKAPLDQRKYETLVLPNDLRVLLCSDPSSTSAAVAMDVHVGASSDPTDVPGLAHFHEHMLFLGTKDYPEEGSFESFLTVNGGASNAFTDGEDTVYYFGMDGTDDAKFNEALQRFGSFFTCPLFTASATYREVNAINNEHAKNLQSDIFRLYQLEKAQMNKEHPMSKFYTGNKETLEENVKKRGIDLRAKLIEFYETYYSSNQMNLAVVAPQPLDQLKKLVSESFSSVPNRNRSKPEDTWAGIIPPFKEGASMIPAARHTLEVVPVQELRQVTLTWPLVYNPEDDERLANLLVKPDFYVSHLLGHEGPGSLLSYLKSKGWANSVGSSSNIDVVDFSTFLVTVELTSRGLDNINDVCEAVFSYIQMMQRDMIPNYIFDEVLQLSELEWRYLTKGDSTNYVQSLVAGMKKYPPSLYVAGPRRMALRDANNDDGGQMTKLIDSSAPRTQFSSRAQREDARNAVSKYVSRLNVNDVMLLVFSKTFEGKTNMVERWYGTKYSIKPVRQSELVRWSNPPLASSLDISFPRPNPFIPTESGLRLKGKTKEAAVKNEKSDGKTDARSRTFEERMVPVSPPTLIRDDGPEGRWTVHFKQDDQFGQPKAFVILQLLTKDAYSTPQKAALGQLYQACVTDNLEEYAYDATLAGLSYDVQVLPRGVRLTFGGYNDKIADFASYITGKLARDLDDVLPATDEEFERYKDNVMRSLRAFDVKQPVAHSSYYATLAIQPPGFVYSNTQLRDATREMTRPDLINYSKNLWSSGTGEALIQGNLDEKEALDFVNAIDRTLLFDTISSDQYPPRLRALRLPSVPVSSNPTKLVVAEPNPSNGNAATQVLLQCVGKSEKDHVVIEILSSIISEPFYEDLRTKQQLGYIVSSGVRALEETRMLAFVVQSSTFSADKLTAAVLKFLNAFRSDYLEKLSEADVLTSVKGLLDKRLEPDKRLSVEVTRNWGEIASGRMQFDRIQRESSALLDIKKDDLLKFWDENFTGSLASDVGGRRLLIAEVVPKTGSASSKTPPKSMGYTKGKRNGSVSPDGTLTLGIDDIEQFRRDRAALN